MKSETNDEISKLIRLGLVQEKLFAAQVLCLPENIFDASPPETLLEPADCVDFAKRLKAAGVNCATALDLGLKSSVLERRSGDKWLGILYIRDNVVIPLVIGVISSLIATGVARTASKVAQAISKSEKKEPEPQIHLELYLERKKNVSRISYTGDGETLAKVLKSLDTK
jgi:hypothetical protein